MLAGLRAEQPDVIADVRGFHLDHAGAHVRQDASAVASGHHTAEIQHRDAPQNTFTSSSHR